MLSKTIVPEGNVVGGQLDGLLEAWQFRDPDHVVANLGEWLPGSDAHTIIFPGFKRRYSNCDHSR